jgi:lysophospholipase L1-like esterase
MNNGLKSRPWHAFQAEESRQTRGRFLWTPEFLIPLVIIAILLAFKAFVMAGVVTGVAAVIWVIRGVSPAGRRCLDMVMGKLAHWVGQGVAVLLLAPAFYVVMPVVRLMNRLTGRDPLQLRAREAPTFWLPSDLESRRVRHARSMFCTERLAAGRFTLLPLAAMVLVLLVAAEVGLRLYGFGTPVVYVQDPDVAYYPKPNQRVRYPGRIITINNHGMRSPDIAAQKTPGHIRILLLGDSTLAGTHVSNEDLYSSLLEKKLNEAAGAPVFEVMNMGVNGWGPFHELAYVKKFGTFEADVAVICGPVIDCYRPLYDLDYMPFDPATNPPRCALEQIAYQACWRYRRSRLGPPPWFAGEPAERQRHLGFAAYTDLARLLQQQGAEVLVEMLPTSQETLGLASDARNRELFAEFTRNMAPLGVPVTSAEGIFKGETSTARIFHDGVHFSHLGHRLYAEYLARHLSETSSRIKKALDHK